MRRGLTDEKFKSVANLVLPVWVDASAAEPLVGPPPARTAGETGARSGRIFALNAESPETGKDYVNRAFCCPPWQRRIMPLRDTVGEGQVDEVMARFKDDLIAQLKVRKEQQLKARLQADPFFVIWELPEAVISLAPDVIERLKEDYPEITCLLLAAGDFSRLPGHALVTRLAPPLPQGVEDAVEVEKGRVGDLDG